MSLPGVKGGYFMKAKSLVHDRESISGLITEFAAGVKVLDVQTHLCSDQQVVAIVIYEELEDNDGK